MNWPYYINVKYALNSDKTGEIDKKSCSIFNFFFCLSFLLSCKAKKSAGHFVTKWSFKADSVDLRVKNNFFFFVWPFIYDIDHMNTKNKNKVSNKPTRAFCVQWHTKKHPAKFNKINTRYISCKFNEIVMWLLCSSCCIFSHFNFNFATTNTFFCDYKFIYYYF